MWLQADGIFLSFMCDRDSAHAEQLQHLGDAWVYSV